MLLTNASVYFVPGRLSRTTLFLLHLNGFATGNFRLANCSFIVSARAGLLQRLDPNVAERNGAVIALQKNRTGIIQVCVQFAARRPGRLDIVVHFNPIEDHRDAIALMVA